MKRRDFLRLAAGALAALGLKLNNTDDQVAEQWEMRTLSESPRRWDWSGGRTDDDMPLDGLEAIRACEPQYACAWADGIYIESHDNGLTWSKMDAIST